MFIGIGTVTNIVTVLIGSTLGLLIGHKLSLRTRALVTDALGLVTLLIAAQAAMEIAQPAASAAVGNSAPVLLVLGSLVVGGILGSWLRIEDRLESFGGWLQGRLARGSDSADRDHKDRFIKGFVTSSLVFCIGPLTILGSINEGIGNGPDQLLLKSALDGFASLAFAAAMGIGVMASVLSVGVVQGGLTLVGVVLGSFLPEAHLIVLTATGGLILVGVALRLLNIKNMAVADLLPALVLAPVATQLVVLLR